MKTQVTLATLEGLFVEEPLASRAEAWTVLVAVKAELGAPKLAGEMLEMELNSRVNL